MRNKPVIVIRIEVFLRIFKIWGLEKFEVKINNGIIKIIKFLNTKSKSNRFIDISIKKEISTEKKI